MGFPNYGGRSIQYRVNMMTKWNAVVNGKLNTLWNGLSEVMKSFMSEALVMNALGVTENISKMRLETM